MQMNISARHRAIADLVTEAGTVSAAQLAEKFGVSLMTVHRDLDALQATGVLRKERGGATAMPSNVFEARLTYRKSSNTTAKSKMAEAALALVEPGMSLLVDDSSSVLGVVDHLADKAPVHVATFSLGVLSSLREVSGIKKIGIGGDYSEVYDAFLGSSTLETISSLYADISFMSGSGVTGACLYHQEDSVAAVKRAMLEVSQRRYVLLDSTKFERTALHKVAPLAQFDGVITDLSDAALVQQLRNEGVTLLQV
ncbi:DeoR/GlpR transcriptional regulator [Micrococcales bacterium 31B]|nr:DeoR/GlpR transcriptional regulator [Micrococcales bacterium 31B]